MSTPRSIRPIPMETSVMGKSLTMYLKLLLISIPPLFCQCRKCKSSMISSRVSHLST